MNDDIESQLRVALRPVSPSEGFAERLAARVDETRGRGRRRRVAATWWISAGLAASLAVCMSIGVRHFVEQRRELAAGLKARSEVIHALRVTNQKLDLALRVVKDESASLDRDEPGA